MDDKFFCLPRNWKLTLSYFRCVAMSAFVRRPDWHSVYDLLDRKPWWQDSRDSKPYLANPDGHHNIPDRYLPAAEKAQCVKESDQ